jgi:alkanesulfonate monooxygenase SsuD/methylene tetrahydromethanopterin reductase-like flavin-dependent oxidoreductase (luciferase family)
MGRGFALFAGTAPEIFRACAKEAEALGYTSFWSNYPGSIDGLAALAGAVPVTQRIDLGVGVIPLQTRGPDSIAQDVNALKLPPTRLLLGVGSANPGALARVRAGVASLRSQVPARIVVAALGPNMCRLAGEVSDAVLFNWLTPAQTRASAELAREAAAAAGRRPPRIFAYVRLSIGAAAREKLRAEGARYAKVPAYAAHFGRMKAGPLETAVAAGVPSDVPAALEAWGGAVDELILRAITAGETVDEYLNLVRSAKP